MKKPLVEYFYDGWNSVVKAADWVYVGKVVLVFIPVVVFTIWYWAIKGLWIGTEYVNKKGDKFLEGFIK